MGANLLATVASKQQRTLFKYLKISIFILYCLICETAFRIQFIGFKSVCRTVVYAAPAGAAVGVFRRIVRICGAICQYGSDDEKGALVVVDEAVFADASNPRHDRPVLFGDARTIYCDAALHIWAVLFECGQHLLRFPFHQCVVVFNPGETRHPVLVAGGLVGDAVVEREHDDAAATGQQQLGVEPFVDVSFQEVHVRLSPLCQCRHEQTLGFRKFACGGDAASGEAGFTRCRLDYSGRDYSQNDSCLNFLGMRMPVGPGMLNLTTLMRAVISISRSRSCSRRVVKKARVESMAA